MVIADVIDASLSDGQPAAPTRLATAYGRGAVDTEQKRRYRFHALPTLAIENHPRLAPKATEATAMPRTAST